MRSIQQHVTLSLCSVAVTSRLPNAHVMHDMGLCGWEVLKVDCALSVCVCVCVCVCVWVWQRNKYISWMPQITSRTAPGRAMVQRAVHAVHCLPCHMSLHRS